MAFLDVGRSALAAVEVCHACAACDAQILGGWHHGRPDQALARVVSPMAGNLTASAGFFSAFR
jgi:hypothetical protein